MDATTTEEKIAATAIEKKASADCTAYCMSAADQRMFRPMPGIMLELTSLGYVVSSLNGLD
ncbi:MAG TPA: hypothetical protein VIX59_11290 [Candidatus Binataceae bacterium]